MRNVPLFERLAHISQKSVRVVAGLISGTSVDGIDAALVRISGYGIETRLELLAFATYPYPGAIRKQQLEISLPSHGTVDDICRMNAAVGECFAEAVFDIAEKAQCRIEEIDLIGSHGQTIHHLPYAEPLAGVSTRGTLQIGEPSIIAKRTGTITVADFRPADMALGGQGAPLAPIMDYLVFRSTDKTRGLLNLGGIANLTVLKRNCELADVVVFDTGPANMVIDGIMQNLFGSNFDEGGVTAAKGKVSPELLKTLLDHPYFKRGVPKSTGREEFGAPFVRHAMALAQSLSLNDEDLLRTAVALTAESVWQAAKLMARTHGEIEELIVSGGGSHNTTVMNELKQRFAPAEVMTTDDFGIPVDAKEAILFAILANETIAGNPGNVPSVTGARAATVLGKICF